MDEMIINCFRGYKKYGQIIKESTIKKNYNENISNINIMIKITNDIFFINCNNNYCEPHVFNNECDFIVNKFNNKYLKYHKIILSLAPLNINYCNIFNIINIHTIPNINISTSEYLLLKLYYYISETTKIYAGLTYYGSDDVYMTYNP